MWCAGFEFDGSQAPAGQVVKRCGITLTSYPVSLTEEESKLLIYFACNIYGDEENKHSFYKSIRTHPRVRFVEENGDFLIVLFEEPLVTKPVYQHNIIHTKPIFISPEGREFWEVASQDKKNLMQFYKVLRRRRNARMSFVKRKRLGSVSIVQIPPQLTTRQHEAIRLAIEEGYYEVPRQTDVSHLARMTGLSFATFQTHLRKAESKLIPFSFRRTQ